VERGVAICGSGVGASVAANKVAGVQACLIHDLFGTKAWELIRTFLAARFTGADRLCRGPAKVAALETKR
jgi:ribose 5-phosphate isomerase B